MRVIGINGPRGVGKSSLAKALSKTMKKALVVSVMRPWHDRMLAVAAPDLPYAMQIDEQGLKDTPLPGLGGMTPRALYIREGERMRRQHGENVFATDWLKRAAALSAASELQYIIVPDMRFDAEAKAAEKLVGKDNFLMIHLHRLNTEWAGDVGEYVKSVSWTASITNNGTLVECAKHVRSVIQRWEKKTP